MKIKMLVIAVLIAFTTAACENSQYGTKQTIGALGGAAAGGLLGAQIGGGSGQLAALAALEIGVEHETGGARVLEQDHAH